MRLKCPKKKSIWDWRTCFAFLPVEINGECVWLEFYERRPTKILYGVWDDYIEWERRTK